MRRPARCAVHPRIRGERRSQPLVLTQGHGSSPHTRGTRPLCGAYLPHIRFIPAYAGNAGIDLRKLALDTVHPRIRGERCVRCPLTVCYAGSSPHTRGTRRANRARNNGYRFIPAYAGNAILIPISFEFTAVHPRIRGERRRARPHQHLPPGSSPHTRGTRATIFR